MRSSKRTAEARSGAGTARRYAWCPVVVLEVAQNGHVDGLAAVLVLGALWALARRPTLAGALLAAATLVKLYPALLVVVLVRRRAWGGLAAFVALCAAAYAPHVLAVGPKVLGYLPGYLREEKYTKGGRFLLLGALGLDGVAAQVVAVALLCGVAVAVLRLRASAPPDQAARRLFGALLLIATPVQPWYAVVLVALAAPGAAFGWLAVAAAAYPLFFATLLDGRLVVLGEIAYAAAAGAVVLTWWRSGRQAHAVAGRGARFARSPLRILRAIR